MATYVFGILIYKYDIFVEYNILKESYLGPMGYLNCICNFTVSMCFPSLVVIEKKLRYLDDL